MEFTPNQILEVLKDSELAFHNDITKRGILPIVITLIKIYKPPLIIY